MKLKLIYILLIIVLISTSCSDPLGVEKNVRITYELSNTLIPLEIGNEWTYQVTYYDSTGIVISIQKINIDVTKEIINNDTSWYQTNDSLHIFTSELVTNKNDGLWITADDSLQTKYNAFHYPATVGDEIIFKHIDNLKDTTYITRKILSINENVQVGAGTYKCIKYWDILSKADGTKIYNPYAIYYFSPKLGLILSVHYEITNLGSIYSFKKIELIDSKLK